MSTHITLSPKGKHQASIIWLHGLGADGNDFVPIAKELQLPAEAGVKFIFPHAPLRPVTINGGMTMRAWFDITAIDINAPCDETGIRQTEKMINQLIEKEMQLGIPSQKIVLAGFSQGGAIALHVGLRYPETLGGIIGLSTFLPLYQQLHHEAQAANKKTPIFLAHGTQDPIVPFQFGEWTNMYLKQLGYSTAFHTYPMQHEVCWPEIQCITGWLEEVLEFSTASRSASARCRK